jgi:hypothetical protein
VSDTADGCSPGGIWRALDGSIAIIDETPRGHIVELDGTQFVGDLTGVTVNGRDCFLDVEKSFLHAVLPIDAALPDGSVEATGSPSAGWTKRSGQLQLNADLRTRVGNNYALSFAGQYDPSHASGSSQAMIAGSYRSTASPEAEVFTIDAAGRVFSQNAETGCVVNGDIAPADNRFNVYRVTLHYGSCQGSRAVLNGIPVKGLALYDASRTPAELFLALDASGTARHYSIVLTEQRT